MSVAGLAGAVPGVPTSLAVAQLSPSAVAADAVVVGGLAVAAAVASAILAAVYRWYSRASVPEALAVLVGLSVVAVYLNTDAALSQVLGGRDGLLDPGIAARNALTFAVAAAAAVVGRRGGDRLVLGIGAFSGAHEVDAELSRLVKSVGRRVTVTLPEDPDDIADIEGYDPVAPETKAALAGRALVFPKGLTVAALRERLVARLREDHGVGHVDVDVAPDGTVEYLAVGSRAAGIGPTLVPGTAATAVRADPAYSATSGDAVQLWRDDGDPEHVATGELRGTAGDVVTLALDEADAAALDPATRYRLLTLARDPRPDREFASLLRRADETLGVVTVSAGSALAGLAVGDLDVLLVAVEWAEGSVEAMPGRDRRLEAGEQLYVVARPEALRRLEAAAESEAESS